MTALWIWMSLALGAPSVESAVTAFQAQDWTTAAKLYRKLLKEEDQATNPGHWFRYGVARHMSGDLAGAAESYERAIALNFPLPTAAYNLACARAKADADGAFAALDLALNQGMGSPQSLIADPDLAPLHDDPRWAGVVNRAEYNERPCMHDDRFRAFDFWLGEWDVYIGEQRVGRNTIERDLKGCVLTERWQGLRGSGQSINVFDPVTETWVQQWVSDSGLSTRYEGRFDAQGVLRMSGETHALGGKTTTVRGSWTAMDDGTVLQVFELQRPDGTWVQTFEGRYVRR